MEEQDKIFVISPVRNIDDATYKAIEDDVHEQEIKGHSVHWPGRGDTNQDDLVGLAICTTNREEIYQSNRIRMWMDKTSAGSAFDLGMLWYFLCDTDKKFEVINDSERGSSSSTLQDVLSVFGVRATKESRDAIHRSEEILVLVDPSSPTNLFRMGMAFASLRNQRKQILIANRDKISRTEGKSFENVFLELTEAS